MPMHITKWLWCLLLTTIDKYDYFYVPLYHIECALAQKYVSLPQQFCIMKPLDVFDDV